MILILAFKLLFSSVLPGFSQTEIRDLYEQGVNNKKAAEKLLNYFESNPKEAAKNILMGYHGAIKIVSAKYVDYPKDKYQKFTSGKMLLEKAILLEPDEIELRFLRYSVQLNVPVFLNYSSFKSADREFLLNKIKNIKDADLSKRIKTFLLAQASLTNKEKELLN